MDQTITYLLIGLAIGSISSLIGAIVSWVIYLRGGNNNGRGALGCVFFVTGALVLVGFVILILSIPSGTIGFAVIIGVGVFVGFSVTFGAMLMLWIRLQNRQSE